MVVSRIQSSQVLEAVSTFNFIAAGAPPENMDPMKEKELENAVLVDPENIEILLPKIELGDELKGMYSLGSNPFLVGFPV
jgi:hypothetical protein